MNCEYLEVLGQLKNWTLFHWGSQVSTFGIKDCKCAALPKSGRSSLKKQKLTTVAKKAFKKRDAAVGGNLRRVWFPGWRERYQDFAPSPSQDTKSQVRKCPLPQVKPTRQGLIFRGSGGLALVEKWWRSIARYPPGFSKGEFSERWKNSNFGNYFQLSFWTV